MKKVRSEKAGLPPGSLVHVSEDPEVATTIRDVYNADTFSEHARWLRTRSTWETPARA